MTVPLVAGLAVAAAAGLAAFKAARSTGLVVAYGAVAACSVWTVVAFVAANRADGMSGIPYAVLGGVLFWFVIVPLSLYVGVAERRRSRAEQR